VLFSRKWFNERLRKVALSDFERNNLFEFNVMVRAGNSSLELFLCSGAAKRSA